MGLGQYKAKRDFKKSPEPTGGTGKSNVAGLSCFVVQKHQARRLHYDFRLELDGVLKSWAVPKGPSLNPADKRLAVHVEDHPLDYAEFEGMIPAEQYGAGKVLIWDRGYWRPIKDPRKGLVNGKLEFELYGERLTGKWALVQMKHPPDESSDNWLLIKEKDKSIDREDGDRLLNAHPESVISGRTFGELDG